MSHDTLFFFFFLEKIKGLVSGGFVINGAYPSSLPMNITLQSVNRKKYILINIFQMAGDSQHQISGVSLDGGEMGKTCGLPLSCYYKEIESFPN